MPKKVRSVKSTPAMDKPDRPRLPKRQETLTDQQRAFCLEYVRLENPRQAAVNAGYNPRHAGVTAHVMLHSKDYPLVQAEVARLQKERDDKVILDAKGVLRYVHTAMLVSLPRYFLPGDDGGWVITPEEFRNLPERVAMLIEEAEFRTVEAGEGPTKVTKSVLWVRLVSKTAMTALAAKHQLKDATPAQQPAAPPPSWDELLARASAARRHDPVAEKLRAIEAPRVVETTPAAPTPPPKEQP